MSEAEYNRYLNDQAAWEADRAYWYQKAYDEQQQRNWKAKFDMEYGGGDGGSGGGSGGGGGDDKDKNEGEEKEPFVNPLPEKIIEKWPIPADEIIKKFDERNKELAAVQAEVAKKVKSVDLTDVYDGYVAGKTTMADGSTKNFEFEIPEEEIVDMRNQLEKKYSDKDLMITDDDAVVAIVRLRFDPTDALDWFFTKGSHQTSLDQWFLDQEIERENALTTFKDPKVSWAEYAGLMMGDDGDYVEDTSDDYDDIDWRNDTGDAFSHMRGYR
jgi:hypothetical protein